jgi:ribosomal protein S18 acetylase RimI-like enzyme
LTFYYNSCYVLKGITIEIKLKLTMIRLTTIDDTTALVSLAAASGLFDPSQTDDIAQMLEAHFTDNNESQDIWLTDDDREPVGMAYIAPERMTEGTWNMYLIAVHPDRQKQGRGKALLQHVEQMLTERGERVLLVETAGTDDFDYVRSFYRQNGYEEEARIREFYTAGVDKIVFRKALK